MGIENDTRKSREDTLVQTWVSKTIPGIREEYHHIIIGIENDTRQKEGQPLNKGASCANMGIENDTQQAIWKASPTQVLKTIPGKEWEVFFIFLCSSFA